MVFKVAATVALAGACAAIVLSRRRQVEVPACPPVALDCETLDAMGRIERRLITKR